MTAARWRLGGLPVRLVICAMSSCIACGCSHARLAVFDRSGPALVWPPPPTPARLSFVGELRSSADLKAPVGAFKAIVSLVVGKEEPERMYGPRAVLCTHGGQRVWVADPGGRRIHMFDLQTRLYRKITRIGDFPLLSPVGLAAGPDNSVFVCDSEYVAIHRLSADDGELIESMRLTEDVQRPVALYYDEKHKEVFVVDAAGHDIKVLSLNGQLLRTLGQRGQNPGEFNFPCNITGQNGALWVVDAGNHRVQGLTRLGEPIIQFGKEGDAPGDLALPKGIAFDSDGHAYVVDARFEAVQIFDDSGRLLLFFGEEGTGEGEFWLPSGIFIDELDRVWVCDTYNGRLQVFQYLAEPVGTDQEE